MLTMLNHTLKTIALLVITLSTFTISHAHANDQDALLKAADPNISGAYVRERFNALQNKPFDDTYIRKNALLIGDSHAQDFLNMVAENGKLSGYQIRTRKIPTQCQIYLGDSHARYIARKDKTLCGDSDNLIRAKKQIEKADLIIFAANWKTWSANTLQTTIEQLSLRPEQKLIIIGRKNFGKINIRRYLKMDQQQRAALKNNVDEVQVEINQIMNRSIKQNPQIAYVDLHAALCGAKDADTCPIFTPEGELISFDGGHLTKAGAEYLGKVLFGKASNRFF